MLLTVKHQQLCHETARQLSMPPMRLHSAEHASADSYLTGFCWDFMTSIASPSTSPLAAWRKRLGPVCWVQTGQVSAPAAIEGVLHRAGLLGATARIVAADLTIDSAQDQGVKDFRHPTAPCLCHAVPRQQPMRLCSTHPFICRSLLSRSCSALTRWMRLAVPCQLLQPSWAAPVLSGPCRAPPATC